MQHNINKELRGFLKFQDANNLIETTQPGPSRFTPANFKGDIMITKSILDYCEECAAAYVVESDSETWETRGEWQGGNPNCEHVREQFPDPPKLAAPVQEVIDNFKEVVWQPLKSHKPKSPGFKRGIV